MRRYLFDSGIASDYVNDRHGVRIRAKAEVAGGNQIGTCIPILAELLYGIEFSATRDRNLQRLHRMLPSLTLWPLTCDGAAHYGRIAADLRRAGRTMQVFDMMAAAVAIDLGNCTVVSKVADLSAIPALSVENGAQ